MKTKDILLLLTLIAMFSSCRSRQGSESVAEPIMADTVAMHRLEGIWLDDETDAVVFRIVGDSIFYPDTINLPARFAIFDDTLVVYGSTDARYPIDHIGDYTFTYQSLTGEMKVRRSDDPEDTLFFTHREYAPILLEQRLRRDTIVFAEGERYHLYIDVSPTQRRVYKTIYTDEGMAVENAYFDNIIHISVYQGRRKVFSRDFHKEDFSELVSKQFIDSAILSNMEFGRTDARGCRFLTTLCEPDGASCYVVELTVGFDGKLTEKLLEY